MANQCEERNGVLGVLKKCFPPSAITGIITALAIALVLWLTGTFNSLPVTYATKPDLKALEIKQAADIYRLDNTKMDKTEYAKAHSDLKSEIRDDLNDIKTESRITRDIVMKILTNQQTQYKKVNGK